MFATNKISVFRPFLCALAACLPTVGRQALRDLLFFKVYRDGE